MKLPKFLDKLLVAYLNYLNVNIPSEIETDGPRPRWHFMHDLNKWDYMGYSRPSFYDIKDDKKTETAFTIVHYFCDKNDRDIRSVYLPFKGSSNYKFWGFDEHPYIAVHMENWKSALKPYYKHINYPSETLIQIMKDQGYDITYDDEGRLKNWVPNGTIPKPKKKKSVKKTEENVITVDFKKNDSNTTTEQT